MRLRQVALVARELEPVKQALLHLLGVDEVFSDEGVGTFGLQNIVIPIGDTFLEVVSPVQEGTTAGRLLDRRGGDGGYMAIVQVDDLAQEIDRLGHTDIRVVWSVETGKARAAHLHPRDVPGAIASLDQMIPPEEWYWAGPGWQKRSARRATRISGVQIQLADPMAGAEKWAQAYGRDLTLHSGMPALQFEEGEIRFADIRDGRGDGLAEVDLVATDLESVLKKAAKLGLPVHNRSVFVCGTVLNFN
jgi:hypothetical protein